MVVLPPGEPASFVQVGAGDLEHDPAEVLVAVDEGGEHHREPSTAPSQRVRPRAVRTLPFDIRTGPRAGFGGLSWIATTSRSCSASAWTASERPAKELRQQGGLLGIQQLGLVDTQLQVVVEVDELAKEFASRSNFIVENCVLPV